MSARLKKRTAEQQAAYDEWLAKRKTERENVRSEDVRGPALDQVGFSHSSARNDQLPSSEIVARLERAERALREVIDLAEWAIHESGITQEPPPGQWVKVGDFIRKYMAPIRDRSREALKA